MHQICLTYSPNWYDRNCLLPLQNHLILASNADLHLLATSSKAIRSTLHLRKHIHDKSLSKITSVTKGLGNRVWCTGPSGYLVRSVVDEQRDSITFERYYKVDWDVRLAVQLSEMKVLMIGDRAVEYLLGDAILQQREVAEGPFKVGKFMPQESLFSCYSGLYRITSQTQTKIQLSRPSEKGCKLLDYAVHKDSLVRLLKDNQNSRLLLTYQSKEQQQVAIRFNKKQQFIKKACLSVGLTREGKIILTGKQGQIYVIHKFPEDVLLLDSNVNESPFYQKMPQMRHYKQIYYLQRHLYKEEECWLTLSTDRKLVCHSPLFHHRYQITFLSSHPKALLPQSDSVFFVTKDSALRQFSPYNILPSNYSLCLQHYRGLLNRGIIKLWGLREGLIAAEVQGGLLIFDCQKGIVGQRKCDDLLWVSLAPQSVVKGEQPSKAEQPQIVIKQKKIQLRVKDSIAIRCSESLSHWNSGGVFFFEKHQPIHKYKQIGSFQVEWLMQNYIRISDYKKCILQIKQGSPINDLDLTQIDAKQHLLAYSHGHSLLVKSLAIDSDNVFQKDIQSIDFDKKVLKVRWWNNILLVLGSCRESLDLFSYNQRLQRKNGKLGLHFGAISDFQVAGPKVVTCGVDNTVKTWNVESICMKTRKKRRKRISKGKQEQKEQLQEDGQQLAQMGHEEKVCLPADL